MGARLVVLSTWQSNSVCAVVEVWSFTLLRGTKVFMSIPKSVLPLSRRVWGVGWGGVGAEFERGEMRAVNGAAPVHEAAAGAWAKS